MATTQTTTTSIPDDAASLTDNPSNNYNRFALSNDLKSQICNEIGESTDSLPNWQQTSRRGRAASIASSASSAPDSSQPTGFGPIETPTGELKHGKRGGGSGILGVDEKTPMPKGDPFEGADLAAQKTVTRSTEDGGGRKGRRGSGHGAEGKERPGALRRLTTKIRRTMSTANGPRA